GHDLRRHHRSPYHQHADHAEQNRREHVLELTGPFANHDELHDLDAGGDHQQPSEEQHRYYGRGHGADDGQHAEQYKTDAKGQEPAPIVDDLRRNADIQYRNLAHDLASPYGSIGLARGSYSAR